MREKRMGHPLGRRIAAAMLALCLLLSITPALAAGGNVASVNGTGYATLTEAITVAQRASAAGKVEEAYTVTLLSDVEAGPFSEAVTGNVILDLDGHSITLSSMFNPSVITIMSDGNLTLKGGGEISTDGNNAIDNRGVLTVMDTVKLSSNKFYGLKNQTTLNLYGGYFAGYTATASATVNLKNGTDTYKTVFAVNNEEFALQNGACQTGHDFKVVSAAPPVPETPVAQIGSKTYDSLSDAFSSLSTTPGMPETPIVIEVLADCGATSKLDVPTDAHAVLKSAEDKGPYTVSRLPGCTGALVGVSGTLTVENLTLDGGAAAGLTADAALVTLVQASGDPIPHLTLGQGAVVRNNVNRQSAGGGVYIWGGTLTLDGGEIHGNSATGANMGGGGVYLEADDPNTTLGLLGGEIRDNAAHFAGGVAVGSSAAVTVSGAPVVRGNKQDGGVESNLYFSDTPLRLTGALTDGAYLGVAQNSGVAGLGVLAPVAAGDGYTITEADYTYFHKDEASALHELRFQNGAISLYQPVNVVYNANGGEGDVPRDTGKYAKDDTVSISFDPPLTRSGHFFKGWATSFSATEPIYAQGGMTEMTAPGYSHISLFAVWEKNPQVLTGAAFDIGTTTAKLTGSVAVYGGFTPASGFSLTKSTGREELAAGGSGILSAALTGLIPGAEYEYQAFTDYNGVRYLGESRRFRTQPEAPQPPTGSIGGSVSNNTGTTCAVTVTIEEGNTIRAAQTLENVGNGASSGFSFTALPDGVYNVVADNGSYKVTRMVIVRDSQAVVNVVLALGKTQSVVEIVTPDTPPAAVEGLPKQFEETAAAENEGYTDANEAIVTSGGTVELKLAVERKEEALVPADAELIAKTAAGQTIPLYLDLSVIKTVIPTAGFATETKLTSVPKLLTVVLPLPDEAAGQQNITIYRVHNGTAETLPKADPGENGEWAESVNGNAILHVRRFSTYAVGYTVSSGSTTYPPTIPDSEHGSITVSPKSPSAGGKVTVTPKPDEGYLVDKVVVTDKNGKEITVKDSGDGTYTFTQPGGKVTITVTFRPAWNPFEDVAEKDWFHDSARYVYENKLMVGTSETAFSPYWDTSRGMIITILWRIESEPGAIDAASFPDIAPDQYYAEAVAWGAEKGIVKGYDNGNYGPDDPITREQLAAILWRYAQFKGWDVSAGETTNILNYPDFAQISEYAIPAIQWAAGAGIMNGKSGGTLDPRGTATRAEAATMLERFLKHIK